MMARVSQSPTPPVRAVVLGHYAGVVGVLADLLWAGGVEVVGTWAADTADGPLPQPPVGVVPVVPVGPGDDTLGRLRDLGCMSTVVGVVWHPDDELDPADGPLTLVRTGSIAATLAATVKATAAGSGE